MFEWDEKKSAGNLEKHQVSFSEAITTFADPEGLDGADVVHSGKEERRIRIASQSSVTFSQLLIP